MEKITAVTMEEKEGAEHIFHLIFFHMIEFLGVGCI